MSDPAPDTWERWLDDIVVELARQVREDEQDLHDYGHARLAGDATRARVDRYRRLHARLCALRPQLVPLRPPFVPLCPSSP